MSINLTKLTADLNAHQNLDNQPSLSASELKMAWDKPANDIKTYINSTLIEEIQNKAVDSATVNALIAAEVETIQGLISAINTRLGTDETNIGNNAAAITGLQNSLNSLTGRVSTLEGKSGGVRTSAAFGLQGGVTQTKDYEDTTNKNGQVWTFVNVLNAQIPANQNTLIGTMAQGFRPATNIKRKVSCGSNTGGGNSWFSELYINSDGKVYLNNQTGFTVHQYNFDVSFTTA